MPTGLVPLLLVRHGGAAAAYIKGLMQLDNDFVRRQFPAFSEPSLQGQAFFENAGGSYACGQVIDRLTRFYRERKVQPYYDFEPSRLGRRGNGRSPPPSCSPDGR